MKTLFFIALSVIGNMTFAMAPIEASHIPRCVQFGSPVVPRGDDNEIIRESSNCTYSSGDYRILLKHIIAGLKVVLERDPQIPVTSDTSVNEFIKSEFFHEEKIKRLMNQISKTVQVEQGCKPQYPFDFAFNTDRELTSLNANFESIRVRDLAARIADNFVCTN